MKATGIVRRIDDLGRVVVPKEIRRTLRIREGDPLEIFTDREGEIILKKYSPIGELSQFALQYAESLAQATGSLVCITDRDQVIAAAGAGRKELDGKPISKQLDTLMEEREQVLASKDDKKYVKIIPEDQGLFGSQAISTIICEGDAIGSVVMYSDKPVGETEKKLAVTAAVFLGRQLEQ
ncbi:MAG: stage V sporulation protein T [Lachnospiraceae bacterium]